MKVPKVADPARELMVTETFGPTFRSEGPSAGRYARFIRMFGCHVSCKWCDSPQAHDDYEVRSVDDVVAWLSVGPPGLVVITGGEPLQQPKALSALVSAIRSKGLAIEIEIETSGTIVPTDDVTAAVTRFVVSPKLARSGLCLHQRVRPAVLRLFALKWRTVWKFVVKDLDDLDEVEQLVTEYSMDPVWIRPEGADGATVLASMQPLADPVLAHGWNLSAPFDLSMSTMYKG